MKKRLVLQFKGQDGHWWTHKYVSFFTAWLCWFYNFFPKYTPKNSKLDPAYIAKTCRIVRV